MASISPDQVNQLMGEWEYSEPLAEDALRSCLARTSGELELDQQPPVVMIARAKVAQYATRIQSKIAWAGKARENLELWEIDKAKETQPEAEVQHQIVPQPPVYGDTAHFKTWSIRQR